MVYGDMGVRTVLLTTTFFEPPTPPAAQPFGWLSPPDANRFHRHLGQAAAGSLMGLRFQAAAAAPKGPGISSLMRCTVPVPTPNSRATFKMPLPARN